MTKKCFIDLDDIHNSCETVGVVDVNGDSCNRVLLSLDNY